MNYSVKDLQKLANSEKYKDFKKENWKYHILWEKIYGRRKDLWLTQKMLSEWSGVPQNKISQLESGTYWSPGIELLKKLSTALEIDESYLLEESIDRKTFEVYNTFLPLIDLDWPWALQFIKIPYFIDIENYKNIWKMMTGFVYRRYNYGPFDKNVYLYQKIFSGNEKWFSKFKTSLLNIREQETIQFIVSIYPCNDGNKLKELSYSSEPMKKIWATLWGYEHWNKVINF